jgi:hypothetical protein
MDALGGLSRWAIWRVPPDFCASAAPANKKSGAAANRAAKSRDILDSSLSLEAAPVKKTEK